MSILTRNKLGLALLASGAGMVTVAGLGAAHYTSQTGFCGSCHEMKAVHTGWARGSHARTHCYDCHVDQGLGAHFMAKANGLRQVYLHFQGKVNMDKVKSGVPSHRCARCHEMNNVQKLGPRIVTAHLKHKEAKLECTICHLASGHSKEAFIGFGQDSCKQCHSIKPQEKTTPYLKMAPCTRKPELQAVGAGRQGS